VLDSFALLSYLKGKKGYEKVDITEAARIKSKYPISLAECFVVSAIKEKAPLVTGDPEFKKLEKEVKIMWI